MKKILLLLLMFTNMASAQVLDLYGVGAWGGTAGHGLLFKITSDGYQYDTLYNCPNVNSGTGPTVITEARNGKLFGMTIYGGPSGGGTIFSYDPVTGSYANQTSFSIISGQLDYLFPSQRDSNILYVVTSLVSSDSNNLQLYSFNMTTNQVNHIYEFEAPAGHGLTIFQAKDGYFYGESTITGIGIIYKLDTLGHNYEVLHTFGQGVMGSYSLQLIEGVDGKLYGITKGGGTHNFGVLFSYSIQDNVYTKLYDYKFNQGDHYDVHLVQQSENKFYGLGSGGTHQAGVLYSIDLTNDSLIILHNFDSSENAYTSMMLASNGQLYGTCSGAGTAGKYNGVIFNYNLANSTYQDLISFNYDNGGGPFDLIEYHTSRAVATGMENVFSEDEMLYPNPSVGEFTLKSSSLIDRISIINLLGETIYNAFPHQKQFSFNIEKQGEYFIRVTSGTQVNTRLLMCSY